MKLLLSATLLGVCLLGQEIHVTSGAVTDQVIQRSAENRADLRLSGTAANGRSVEARVLYRNAPLAGFDWKSIAATQGGKWDGEIRGVPAGGPYRIELRAGEAATAVDNVLVGDLWILAGQSNMEGVADLVDVEPRHEMVHSFDQTDHWGVAEEPLHRLPDAADRVHWRRNAGQPEKLTGDRLQQFIMNRKKGAGLGLPFAVEMVRRTGVPVGLVPCAHGGTSMDQWDPALRDQGGDSLYGAMVRRFRAVGGRVKGVLWYQGESDANPKAAPVFQQKFEKFVAAVREDFGQPGLPFFYVQIGRHVNASNLAEWNAVQESQRKAETAIPHSGMAAAIDLSLDDGIHVSTQDHKRLGKRLANLAAPGGVKMGPRPVSARYENGILRVLFSDVNHGLRAPGRISGFTIHAPSGDPVPLIYKARVDPSDRAVVLLHIGGKLPEGAVLRYGWGKDPYCNLTDEADMAVPVFGPMAIQ